MEEHNSGYDDVKKEKGEANFTFPRLGSKKGRERIVMKKNEAPEQESNEWMKTDSLQEFFSVLAYNNEQNELKW